MDFIARAGAVIDRAHRVAGVLLICVIVLGLMAMCEWNRNVELQQALDVKRMQYPVIVVPEATTGVYSPTEEDRLIQLFTGFITQSLNSYTPETIGKQLEGLRPFMTPAMLTDSEPYFTKLVRDVGSDKRSSFFVPYDSTLRSINVRRYNDNGVELRDISINGQLSSFVGGSTAETIPVRIDMTFQKGFASPSNIYGFKLKKYTINTLSGEAARAGIVGGGDQGSTAPGMGNQFNYGGVRP
jgi:hypothetical protein